MFFPESEVRVCLHTQPADMCKSYDRLCALAKNKLQEDPLSGQLFVFINRKGNQTRIVYFDCSGYCIWGKGLEQGGHLARILAQRPGSYVIHEQ